MTQLESNDGYRLNQALDAAFRASRGGGALAGPGDGGLLDQLSDSAREQVREALRERVAEAARDRLGEVVRERVRELLRQRLAQEVRSSLLEGQSAGGGFDFERVAQGSESGCRMRCTSGSSRRSAIV